MTIRAFAIPKSVSFTSPCSLTRMLWGLMSRWTMPSGLPCREFHELLPAADGSTFLMFYRCAGASYVGAIKGRSIVGARADVKGTLGGKP